MGLPSITLFALTSIAHLAAASFASEERNVDWGRDVRPLLAARCFTCHGPDPSTRKADLRLDEPHGALAKRAGGRAAIVPGAPEESEAYRRLSAHDPDERMPPAGPPLNEQERELIRRWIAEGAQWSDAWSWRPVEATPLPEVRDASWVRDPLDRFVLAGLEQAGIEPAPRADARTLLRRASYDLTGLPPDVEAQARTAQDPSPEAFAREVDRMLASPAFGERWGRHWLDLVRYAETYGHEFDYPIPYAWRYRDAVVQAFNENRPYDRFVRDHIAGDLIADHDPRLTGFWWLTQGTHGPVDVAKDEADRIDNQIDVLSKTFLGITVACARCHDHKFDLITQRDYYGLSAHIKRARRAVVEGDPRGEIARERATLLARRAALEESVPGTTRASKGEPDRCAADESFLTTFDEPCPPGFDATGHAFALTPEERPRLLPRDQRLHRAPSDIATSRAAADGFAGTLRSPSFKVDVPYLHQRLRGVGTVRVIIDGYHLDEHNPLLFEGHRREINHPDWSVVTWDLSRYLGHRAYIEWVDAGPGFLEIDWAMTSGHGACTPAEESASQAEEPIDDEAVYRALVELNSTKIPEPELYLAITEGTPWTEHIHTRGVASALGAAVTPGHIASLEASAWGETRSGASEATLDRRALAERIADPQHPLTARVMVNRLWHHLMGQGIVGSVDDFGALGTPPTNPALLDHLADRFRREWDIKKMIRAMVVSSTYAMSSSLRPDVESLDPTNALRHRASVRRLDAEALRDSMLLLAGRLNPTMGGPGVATHLTEHMDGRGRPGHSGPVDGDGRRSVYLEVRRNFPDPFLVVFDLPVPTSPVGRRNRSNVPGQALALLNSPFVHAMAAAWGERLAASEQSTSDRIAGAIERAFARPARPEEVALAEAFLLEETASAQSPSPSPAAWAALTHVLFNAKEFLFLD